jgi:5'-3' exonuclease
MPDVPLLLVDGSNLLFRARFGFPARIRSRDKTSVILRSPTAFVISISSVQPPSS